MQREHGPLDTRHIQAIRRMHRAAAATLDRLDRTNAITQSSHELLRRARRDGRGRDLSARDGSPEGRDQAN